MFRLLGVLLLGYVAYSVLRGETYAKRGPWGRNYRLADGPARFWSIIGAYLLLAAALIVWFSPRLDRRRDMMPLCDRRWLEQ